MLPAAPLAWPMVTRSAEVGHCPSTGGGAEDGLVDADGLGGADGGTVGVADAVGRAGLVAAGGAVVCSAAVLGWVAARVVPLQAAASRAVKAMAAAVHAGRPERGSCLIDVGFPSRVPPDVAVTDRTPVGHCRLCPSASGTAGQRYELPEPGTTTLTLRMLTGFEQVCAVRAR